MNQRLLHDKNKITGPFLLGLDEVGWGCIAGELVLGACIVSKSFFSKVSLLDPKIVDMIRDSKKLSDKKREEITQYFENQKILGPEDIKLVLGRASVEEINEKGLAPAFDLCVKRILAQAPKSPLILLDGKRVPDSLDDEFVELIIKGDDTSWVIGLASVWAKTHRDRQMDELSKKHPEYGFKDHKGYGTSAHISALKSHGITEHHRTKGTTTILSNN